MPKIEKISVMDPDGQTVNRTTGVNLDFSVGENGANGPADIMLIQALFNYIAPTQRAASKYFGLSLRQIPKITTKIDAQTRMAILAFQRTNRSRLLSADGLVEPAKDEGRVIRNAGGRVMTITRLDQVARYESADRREYDHIDALIKLEPRLEPWLV